MFENVYEPEDRGEDGRAARRIIKLLYDHYRKNRDEILPEYGRSSGSESQAVVDYVAGMTDQYALRVAEKIQPDIAEVFSSRLL